MVPREHLTIRFTRSGGPGGQNVNKVETRVEVRFVVATAAWIPPEVRARLLGLPQARVNREGELVISSSRFRTQARNLEDCIDKLGLLLEAASRAPKRRIPTRPTRASRRRRSGEKKARSERKRARGWRQEE